MNSRRSDQIRFDEHTNLASQQIQQDRHAIAITYILYERKAVDERTIDDSDPVTGRETRPGRQADKSSLVFACSQRVDHAVLHQGRSVSYTYEMRNTECG